MSAKQSLTEANQSIQVSRLENSIQECQKQLQEEQWEEMKNAVQKGDFSKAREVLQRSPSFIEESKTNELLPIFQQALDGQKALKEKKYSQALETLEKVKKKLESSLSKISLPVLEQNIFDAKSGIAALKRQEAELKDKQLKEQEELEKKKLKEREEQKKKQLLDLFSKAEKAYQEKKWRDAQNLLEKFFSQGGKDMASHKEKAAKYLALAYAQDKKWSEAMPWFSQIKSDSDTLAYYGLACYHTSSDDAKALDLVSKALQKKPTLLLARQLRKAKADILIRSFSDQENQVFQALKDYEKNSDSNEDLPLLWKKLGQLAKKRGLTKEARQYWERYLEHIAKSGKEDEEIAYDLISLYNFYPLAHGNYWRYRASMIAQGTSREINIKVLSSKPGNQWEVDVDGTPEIWEIKNEFLYKRNLACIPYPFKTEQWDRSSSTHAKITNLRCPVETDVKKFICVEVTLTFSQSSDVLKEYYAPEVGEVKSVRYQGDKKTYERVLTKFRAE
jgi:tetratricopeptide (TPR) repeat protein